MKWQNRKRTEIIPLAWQSNGQPKKYCKTNKYYHYLYSSVSNWEQIFNWCCWNTKTIKTETVLNFKITGNTRNCWNKNKGMNN